jgi:tetratricopeptide (TPR) repeat protein
VGARFFQNRRRVTVRAFASRGRAGHGHRPSQIFTVLDTRLGRKSTEPKMPEPKLLTKIFSARRRAKPSDEARERREAAAAAATREQEIKRADEARDRRDAATAAVLYQSVIERWGQDFGILVQLGNARKDSGAFEDAEQAYKSALALKPGDADCHLQYGHLMKLAGNLARAGALYAEASRLDPALLAANDEIRALRSRAVPSSASVVSESFTVDVSSESSVVESSTVQRPLPRPVVQSHRRAAGWDLDAPSLIVCERLFTTFQWRRN